MRLQSLNRIFIPHAPESLVSIRLVNESAPVAGSMAAGVRAPGFPERAEETLSSGHVR